MSDRVSDPPERKAENSPGEGKLGVRMREIWKTFPGVVANQGIDLDLENGEVHALLGENGAGKTTAMNILSGLYRPERGRIWIDTREAVFGSPADAIAQGIGMVHQHFQLVENMTAAENIHLGWAETPSRVSSAELTERTERICQEHGLAVDPGAKIWQLSVGEQQRVEILRVLARKARLLILDEPTSVLTPREADELFAVMRSLAAQGKTVVFISHKLAEVMEVSDRISVLRKGRVVSTMPTSECNLSTLARLMIGREVLPHRSEGRRLPGKTILELRQAYATSDRGLPALRGTSLIVHEGEILGIAGVAGNGQKELVEVLAGMRDLDGGDIILDGKTVTGLSPELMARAGMGHIPEDRSAMGLILDLEVKDNAILREFRDPPLARGWFQVKREVTRFAEELVKQAKVVPSNVTTLVRHLSGGNQQRLLAARETRIASKALLAVHPTRGLDVGATEEVRRILLDHRVRGAGVLLVSEDLDELLMIADRIAVMFAGRIAGEFTQEDSDSEKIGLMMGGHVQGDGALQ